jgi:hypothetical protein
MIDWPWCFGPVAKHHILVVGVVEQNYSVHGQEAKGRGRDQGLTIPFNGTPPPPRRVLRTSHKAPPLKGFSTSQ